MIPITDQTSAAQARYEIEREVYDSADRELFIGDQLWAQLATGSFEFTVEWGKLIFAWWSEDVSQSWRVSAYEINGADLRLQATRGIGREMAILTLRDVKRWLARDETLGLSLPESRQEYAQALAHLIESKFDGAKIERVTTGADRAHSVAGRYARLVIRLKREIILAIGVNKGETQADVDGIITNGLIWIAGFNAERKPKQQAGRIWFCLPRERLQTVIERLTFVDLSHLNARIECFEADEMLTAIEPRLIATQYELLNSHPREMSWPAGATPNEIWRGRILARAPHLIEVKHPLASAKSDETESGGETYSINGLEFARTTLGEKREIRFGVATATLGRGHLLTESNFNQLERLIEQIAKYRSPDTPDRRHDFYRLRTESWLESLLRRNISALDATLDSRFVYSQIPAWRGDERSVLDLLTINHQGRLVVIEIKAVEDAQLPFQGLDYWLRVEQARLRGELAQRGLFAGIEIAGQSPLLYLVAPRLRFHRTFAMLARCLTPEIEAFQIGLNTNWRSGVHVHSRERVNTNREITTGKESTG